MKKFSKLWIKSKNAGKQRKYRANAPLHIKQKFTGCHLSKELIKKYNKRSITLRKGDKIKVLRGQFKGKTGKVDTIDLKKTKVRITGIDFVKKDVTKAFYPLHPSNLVITELTVEDKKRLKNTKEEK